MQINLKMAKRIDEIQSQAVKVMLPAELLSIVEQGFEIRQNCALLVAQIPGGSNASLKDFPDRTGYECFINSFHIDDYVDGNFVEVAYAFAKALLNLWRQSQYFEVGQVIVAETEFGSIVKFHLLRAGESWLDDDLETYDVGILVLDSSCAI